MRERLVPFLGRSLGSTSFFLLFCLVSFPLEGSTPEGMREGKPDLRGKPFAAFRADK